MRKSREIDIYLYSGGTHVYTHRGPVGWAGWGGGIDLATVTRNSLLPDTSQAIE